MCLVCVQEGWTALHLAGLEERPECPECLKELLARGAAVNQAMKVRAARLCPAALAERKKGVKL